MKNRPVLLAILLLPLLLSACGKMETPPTDSPPPREDEAPAPRADSASAFLPAPKELLACPGFLSIAEVRGDAQMGAARLLSSESVSTIVEFYTANLAAEGWVMGASVMQEANQHLQFSQNGRFLRFQISPAADANGSSIQIAWKQPASATEFGEAHSPELEDEAPDPGSQGSREW
jgi:hypothetical protein